MTAQWAMLLLETQNYLNPKNQRRLPMKYEIGYFSDLEEKDKPKEVRVIDWLNDMSKQGWHLVSVVTAPIGIDNKTSFGVVKSSITIIVSTEA